VLADYKGEQLILFTRYGIFVAEYWNLHMCHHMMHSALF